MLAALDHYAVILLTRECAETSRFVMRRTISAVASGRAKRCAQADILLRALSSRSRETTARDVSSGLFVTIPAPASATRAELRCSGPGMASKSTSGNPQRAASAIVRPPGLVTNTDATFIRAAMSSVHPSKRREIVGLAQKRAILRRALLS